MVGEYNKKIKLEFTSLFTIEKKKKEDGKVYPIYRITVPAKLIRESGINPERPVHVIITQEVNEQ